MPVQVAGWVVSGLSGMGLDILVQWWRARRGRRVGLERQVLRALLGEPYHADREARVVVLFTDTGVAPKDLHRVFERLERRRYVERDSLGVLVVTAEGTAHAEEDE